jgi:hypothetical protein
MVAAAAAGFTFDVWGTDFGSRVFIETTCGRPAPRLRFGKGREVSRSVTCDSDQGGRQANFGQGALNREAQFFQGMRK